LPYIYFKRAKKDIKKGRVGLLSEGLLKVSFYFIPVDHVPPSRYIVRSAVLVLEIISMFPYVKTQKRDDFFCLPLRPRTCLVRHGYELDAICILVVYEPAPAASLYCDTIL
jgi:hypothetical protein